MCSGWRRSSTETAPAPRTCRSTQNSNQPFSAQPTAPKPPKRSKERRHDDHARSLDPGTDHRVAGSLRLWLGRLRCRGRQRAARTVGSCRARHLQQEERARVDARRPAQGAARLRQEADAELGLQPRRHSLRQHQVLRALEREAGRNVGRPARRHQEHLRQARHPRGGEAASGVRRRRSVRVRGRLPLDPRGSREAGRHLPRHRHRSEGASGAVQAVLRHGHPGR